MDDSQGDSLRTRNCDIRHACYCGLKTLESQIQVWDAYRLASKITLPDDAQRVEARLRGAVGLFRGHLIAFQDAYRVVGSYWPVKSSAIEFDQRATSALEAALWRAMNLEDHIAAADPTFDVSHAHATFEFLSKYCDDDPRKTAALRARIRCEESEVRDLRQNGFLTSVADCTDPVRIVKEACYAEATDHLPWDWCDLAPEGKLNALRNPTSDSCGAEQAVLNDDDPAISFANIADNGSRSVFILGKRFTVTPQVKLLLVAMCKVCPEGLSLNQVRSYHKKGQWVLGNLARDDQHWRAALSLPGVRGAGGYKVRTVREARAWLGNPEPLPATQEPKRRNKPKDRQIPVTKAEAA